MIRGCESCWPWLSDCRREKRPFCSALYVINIALQSSTSIPDSRLTPDCVPRSCQSDTAINAEDPFRCHVPLTHYDVVVYTNFGSSLCSAKRVFFFF